jgi:hypothetical protein
MLQICIAFCVTLWVFYGEHNGEYQQPGKFHHIYWRVLFIFNVIWLLWITLRNIFYIKPPTPKSTSGTSSGSSSTQSFTEEVEINDSPRR